MAGSLFAIATVGVLAGTFVLLRYRGGRPSFGSALNGIAAGLGSFVVLSVFAQSHLCDRGAPVRAIYFYALSIGLAVAAIPARGVRWRTVLRLSGLSFVLVIWGVGIVHDQSYIGNPQWPEMTERMAARMLRNLQKQLAREGQRNLSAGWLDDVWVHLDNDGHPLPLPVPPRQHLRTCWHTFFTGIYGLNMTPQGIWCPGGLANKCVLEIRARH